MGGRQCRSSSDEHPLGAAQAAQEIGRPAPVVRNRHDFEALGEFNENHRVREAVNRHASNLAIRNIRNTAANLRELFDQLERPSSFGRESICDTWIFVSIPAQSFTEFKLRGSSDLDQFQRPSTSL